MFNIIMPQVGQDLPTARIVNWLKKVGDPVKKGEVVAVVESEKAIVEVEAEKAGVLSKILHEEGAEVEILQPIALLKEEPEASKSLVFP